MDLIRPVKSLEIYERHGLDQALGPIRNKSELVDPEVTDSLE